MAKRKQKNKAPKEEEWNISESATERLLDLIIALILMCAILCWSLVTFTIREHIVLIILAPLLCYFTLSSPGTRLRLRERRSLLIVTDVLALLNVTLCCLFVDYVYRTEVDYMVPKMVFGILAAVLFCLYISRAKFMYYLIVPATFGVNWAMLLFWGADPMIGVAVIFTMPIPYCLWTFSHPYYFGFGRVKVKDKYRRYPEAIAKRMRAKQAQERKAERRERIRQNSKKM